MALVKGDFLHVLPIATGLGIGADDAGQLIEVAQEDHARYFAGIVPHPKDPVELRFGELREFIDDHQIVLLDDSQSILLPFVQGDRTVASVHIDLQPHPLAALLVSETASGPWGT